MNGECEGRVHHDSQFFESNIFKLAIEPTSIFPCSNPLGCGVVMAGFLVEQTRVAKGSTPHRLTNRDDKNGILNI